ncbi:MAG TPA: efflux RND transporter periplasmic adaptor subunit, partial [bacterium]|nr:efflux RND transporter periplasmic adaptor subunit [bacterium]
VIPETAVLLTGKRALTWVMTSPHHFEQREIMLGEKVGDQYTVLSGITAGEVIVKTGGYLIDSESQLTGK